MRRDWSLPGVVSAVPGLGAEHVMQTNVTPVYKFFNGRSSFYELRHPPYPRPTGGC